MREQDRQAVEVEHRLTLAEGLLLSMDTSRGRDAALAFVGMGEDARAADVRSALTRIRDELAEAKKAAARKRKSTAVCVNCGATNQLVTSACSRCKLPPTYAPNTMAIGTGFGSTTMVPNEPSVPLSAARRGRKPSLVEGVKSKEGLRAALTGDKPHDAVMHGRHIAKGEASQRVQHAQKRLAQLMPSAGVPQHGLFDDVTEKHVKDFQRQQGLWPHGKIDLATANKMRSPKAAAKGADVKDAKDAKLREADTGLNVTSQLGSVIGRGITDGGLSMQTDLKPSRPGGVAGLLPQVGEIPVGMRPDPMDLTDSPSKPPGLREGPGWEVCTNCVFFSGKERCLQYAWPVDRLDTCDDHLSWTPVQQRQFEQWMHAEEELGEAVAAGDGSAVVRLTVRADFYARRIEETWSEKARAAALIARRLHHQSLPEVRQRQRSQPGIINPGGSHPHDPMLDPAVRARRQAIIDKYGGPKPLRPRPRMQETWSDASRVAAAAARKSKSVERPRQWRMGADGKAHLADGSGEHRLGRGDAFQRAFSVHGAKTHEDFLRAKFTGLSTTIYPHELEPVKRSLAAVGRQDLADRMHHEFHSNTDTTDTGSREVRRLVHRNGGRFVTRKLHKDIASHVGAFGLREGADSMMKATVHEPVGKPGGPGLWGHKGLQLPAYIQHIANDIKEKRGLETGKAISIAIGAVKRWARGGGKVDAGTKAAAVKALAEWEKLKLEHGFADDREGDLALVEAGLGRFEERLHPRKRPGAAGGGQFLKKIQSLKQGDRILDYPSAGHPHRVGVGFARPGESSPDKPYLVYGASEKTAGPFGAPEVLAFKTPQEAHAAAVKGHEARKLRYARMSSVPTLHEELEHNFQVYGPTPKTPDTMWDRGWKSDPKKWSYVPSQPLVDAWLKAHPADSLVKAGKASPPTAEWTPYVGAKDLTHAYRRFHAPFEHAGWKAETRKFYEADDAEKILAHPKVKAALAAHDKALAKLKAAAEAGDEDAYVRHQGSVFVARNKLQDAAGHAHFDADPSRYHKARRA